MRKNVVMCLQIDDRVTGCGKMNEFSQKMVQLYALPILLEVRVPSFAAPSGRYCAITAASLAGALP
jgi:hypothetical protein